MATVPYSGAGPDVTPDTRAPDDYQRIETNPDMFGASIGKGLDQLEAGIQKAQQFYGQVAVDDQVNKVMSTADTIRRGDPNKIATGPDGNPILGSDGKPQPDLGYLGLRGEDAMRARPGVESQIDSAIAASRANLSTPEQQLEFDKQTRRMRSAWADEIGQHAERQNQTWAIGVANSAADQARQHIAANVDNPAEFQNGLEDLTHARLKQAQLTYGDDPSIQADAMQKARGEAAATRIEALQNIDPLRAKTFLEANRTNLPPETYDKFVTQLRPMIAGASAPEAIRWAATGQPAQGGQPTTALGAAGQANIPDSTALAAQSRLNSGAGTDADRATLETYRQQQNTPSGQPGASPSAASSSPVPVFARVAAAAPAGYSPAGLARVGQIESGGRANAGAGTDHVGWGQFSASTWAAYGQGDRTDPIQSMLATQRYAAANNRVLTGALGRTPDDAELYLAHQQGPGGAAKLLTHPNARAGDLVGDAAIKGNGGDPNAPASAFTAMWVNKFNHTHGAPPVPTFIASGITSPTAVPTDAPPLPTMSPDVAPTTTPQPTLMEQAGTPNLSPPPAAPSATPPVTNLDDPSSPLPDRDLALAHAREMAGGDPIQARMNIAEVNRRYEEQNRETYTERTELGQRLPDIMAAASAGVDGVTLPEQDVWRLYPRPKARQIIDEFHANQAVGGLMRGVQWASPQQLAEMQRDISSGQGVYSDSLRVHRGAATTGAGTTGADPDGTGDIAFFRRREVAARQINSEVQKRNAALVGPEADPAAYVGMSPALRQAEAGTRMNDPASFERYATASLGMQGFLGVPEAQQHVLTRAQALNLAGQISGSQDPKAIFAQMQTAWGGTWPSVFRDAISLGRLPPAYQAVQTLDDPHDAALLARALSSEKPGPDGKPAKSIDETVELMGGSKGDAAKIRDAVRYDPDVAKYAQSIQKSGASPDQVMGIVNAVETLALAKRGAGEATDASSAASAAVKSFFGRFDYMPNGGARVPANVMDAVSANARSTLDGLGPEHIAVPPRFGQQGQPEPQEYINTIKAAPTWITSPKSDALWLMDYGGRIVRGKDDRPVAVPFNRPLPAPAPQSAPPDTPAAAMELVPGP